MVTIYDIAKQAEVSAMTVSRVINNTGRISEKTREKVRKVMEELNYVPNAMARGLVLQKTGILSLLVTDITNPFYTTVARGAEDAARSLGYKLLLGNSDEDGEKEKEYIDMILSTRVDGILITPAGDSSKDRLEAIVRHGTPFVTIDRDVPGIACDHVIGDSVGGARKLIDYLASLGHRIIALVGGSFDVSTARDRHEGYREALAANGLPYDERLVLQANYRMQDMEDAAEQLLLAAPMPTAILAGNNMLALGLLQAFRRRGIDVPGHLSIVTFDDFGHRDLIDPLFTTAVQPAYQFGMIGIQMLVGRIEGKYGSLPQTSMLPNSLVIGSSTSVPRQEGSR
ncbi:LacI family DNA-binding transcriptional regulator [Paenibacillus sp. MMS18-CY102]|uniref:LacI family DNA-binding transcriptional regulator n=1 Tax=Paenibacillus sp. MMS18-CY102 TaxID=2682849 RepID=UPI001365DBA1|nr:LacI family DNA-binding transcriptional regulator [Paenibacillus sp. MMS18-CY102]MWC28684.1 substrate-binding domain-containing protein [Paenibacillus sp. MMS18-CY102]